MVMNGQSTALDYEDHIKDLALEGNFWWEIGL